MTQTEAREIDQLLVDLERRRQTHPMVTCRMVYLMSQEGFRALGFASFRAYLQARGLRRDWAFVLKGVYAKLSVQLGLPETAWADIPLTRLQGCLSVISRHNVRQVLAEARVMTRTRFRSHIRALRGRAHARLRGTYQLVPSDRPAAIDLNTRREVHGSAYASKEGTLYVDIRDGSCEHVGIRDGSR